ncbi:MAG: C_GCAxxG_C_C family protein [Clostridiales bacterium]|nr:C_GCAxxG_C_C family protein [Clostridiales bacterium]
MDKQQKIDHAVAAAKHAIIRDDICSRSVLVGLKDIFDDIPDEMITASLSLAGGTGSASGSCGAYCCGLLAVGLKYNAPLEDELKNPGIKQVGAAKFCEYRDRFLKEFGTVMCPELQRKIFGRAYNLVDPTEHMEFLSTPGHEAKCAEIVGAATRLAAEMILADED